MNAWLGRVGPLFIILIALAGLGLLTLTSVAGGEWAPYAQSHMYKALLAFLVFFICAALPAELWQQTGYLLHFFAILLLLVVEVIGETTKGAARWLDLGFRLQPSEMVKITILFGARSTVFSIASRGNDVQTGYCSYFGHCFDTHGVDFKTTRSWHRVVGIVRGTGSFVCCWC